MSRYRSHELRQCVEAANRYILLLNWNTLDDLTAGFRGSAGHQEWKQLLHHFYDSFPVVEHYAAVPDAPD